MKGEHHAQRHLHRKVESAAKAEKEPEYMIQVSDPKMVRKDLLESLREVIIFMQGYETFRKIQEEKVTHFALLKSQVKDLNSMIDTKLRKYLPKGKLHGIVEKQAKREEQREELLSEEPRIEVVQIERSQLKKVEAQPRAPPNELAELEKQLREIENQLKNIH